MRKLIRFFVLLGIMFLMLDEDGRGDRRLRKSFRFAAGWTGVILIAVLVLIIIGSSFRVNKLVGIIVRALIIILGKLNKHKFKHIM